MSPEQLLEQFGYYAVFIGTFLEGETILVLAGFFAARRYLYLPNVILVGFAGVYLAHIFWFWLGRTKGLKLLKRFTGFERHIGRGVRLFERYGAPAIFISQYLYGLRISCTIIVGLSKIPLWKFLIYQALSCAMWAVVVASLGYYFGEVVESLLGRAVHVERYGLVVILLIAFGFWVNHRWKEKRRARLETAGESGEKR